MADHTATMPGTPEPEPPADELRTRIRDHLARYPDLTDHAIARALGVDRSPVRTRLKSMHRDGDACSSTEKRPGDSVPVTRWRLTAAATAAREETSSAPH